MDNNADIGAVGAWLRGARESRGESLDDVARVTRIGKGYLEAIELGEMHKLPSEAYARGFVRLYATHLGLSGDEAVARLKGKGEQPSVVHAAEDAPVTTRDEGRIRPVNGTSRRWAIPLALFVVLLGFALVSRMNSRGTVPVAPAPPAPSPQIPDAGRVPAAPVPQGEQVRQAAPTEGAEPAPVPAEAAPSEGIILRLKAVQTGKLHITIDGAVSQEYDLNVGDLVEWKAEKMFLLELDNAGSVEGDLNGRPLQPLGEPGRAAHLVIGADGVRQQ